MRKFLQGDLVDEEFGRLCFEFGLALVVVGLICIAIGVHDLLL